MPTDDGQPKARRVLTPEERRRALDILNSDGKRHPLFFVPIGSDIHSEAGLQRLTDAIMAAVDARLAQVLEEAGA